MRIVRSDRKFAGGGGDPEKRLADAFNLRPCDHEIIHMVAEKRHSHFLSLRNSASPAALCLWKRLRLKMILLFALTLANRINFWFDWE